ncbi:MAG: hypothetical protein LIQ31_16425 [Planctomycetes bacterium]|nr:hypothetical protein [Planctomycetota bacterium]
MFEMLLEALKELFDPTPNRPPPRRRASQSGTPGGQPVSPDQTARPGEVRRAPSGAPAEVTIEDVFRKLLTGEDEAAREARHRDREATEQAETAGRTGPARAARQSGRRSARQGRGSQAVPANAAQVVAPKPRPAQAARPLSFQETIARAERQDAVFKEEQDAEKGVYGLEFVQKLRSNPAAAREAFVSAEIFGRPLSERRMDF